MSPPAVDVRGVDIVGLVATEVRAVSQRNTLRLRQVAEGRVLARAWEPAPYSGTDEWGPTQE